MVLAPATATSGGISVAVLPDASGLTISTPSGVTEGDTVGFTGTLSNVTNPGVDVGGKTVTVSWFLSTDTGLITPINAVNVTTAGDGTYTATTTAPAAGSYFAAALFAGG